METTDSDIDSLPVISGNESEIPPHVTGPLVTKKEGAQLIGVSAATFQRRVREKVFKPVAIRETDRALMFEERSITTTVSTTSTERTERIGTAEGAVAARVFKLLDEKMNLADIVQELEVGPTIVKVLAAQWAEMRGVFLIYPDEAKELENAVPRADPSKEAPGIKTTADVLTLVRTAKRMMDNSGRELSQAREVEHRVQREQQSAPHRLKHIENMKKLEIAERKLDLDKERLDKQRQRDQYEAQTRRLESTSYKAATPSSAFGLRSRPGEER